MKNVRYLNNLLIVLPTAIMFWSCSGDDPEPGFNCADSTLSITAESPEASDCLNTNGKIVATATGGEGTLMYSLDDGSFQASPEFTDLAPGVYNVNVTDDSNCVSTATVTVISGISFAAEIQPIIENSCAISGCHDGSTGLPNFNVFSNLQSRSAAVKSRTQSGDMPRSGSLTSDEIAKIACWVDDGALNN